MAKLYGSKSSYRMRKVLIAAKLAGKDVNLVEEEPPAKNFPLGTTPAYVDGDLYLFGAESIATHLLLNYHEQCHSNRKLPELVQWIQWSEGRFLPNILGYVLPCMSLARVDEKIVEASKKQFLAEMKGLNQVLLQRTFLVGECLSLADISVALNLLIVYENVLDSDSRSEFVNVTRWFNTVVNQTKVKEVIGSVQFAVSVAKFDKTKFDEICEKSTKSAAKSGKGSEKIKKVDKIEKKKAGTRTERGNGSDDADAFDEVLRQEPKTADPFATMPKGTFVMDAFKRVYSNEDTATKAIPYFWENFDPENYSIWYCTYKYPEELKLIFMSTNLIGGMFQRLDNLRKNAFASVCVFGTDNNSTISGIWIWRGHELVFDLCPDWQVDYESYDWQKLDPRDENTRKVIKDYLMWEGDFDGKQFNQGKILK